MSALDRHDKIVLQFSGGKDSLACLYLLREYWDKITVVWVNTGAAYPEVIEQMAEIRDMVPHFHEVQTNAIEHVLTFGAPSDVVPEINTAFGHGVHKHGGMAIQSWRTCCSTNLWLPLQAAVRELGATLVVRGSRRDDLMVSGVRDGDVIEGIEYHLPLEDWTAEQVVQYLNDEDIELPAYYAYSDTSLDCWHCTAFVKERERELHRMREHDPAKWEIVGTILEGIDEAVTKELNAIHDVLGEN